LRTDRHIVIAAAATALLGMALLGHLVLLRFSTGQDFAPYSTLRADPLGAKALYEALGQLPGASTARLFDNIPDLGAGAGKTLFLLGMQSSIGAKKDFEVLQDFAATGGRIVITYSADKYVAQTGTKDSEKEESPKPPTAPAKKEFPERERIEHSIDSRTFEEVWNFKTRKLPRPESAKDEPAKSVEVVNERTPATPQSLPWHSRLYFEDLDPAWRLVYLWRETPLSAPRTVVMERPWHAGTIVLCSDSYLLSNEAMRLDRKPEFIAWLAGASHELLFDETHLGTSYEPGLMVLIRRYRLHGALLLMLALALLFCWKNMTSLLPKRPVLPAANGLAGPAASSAIENLLRRTIPARRILAVCVEEWRRTRYSPAHAAPLSSAQKEELDRLTRIAADQQRAVKPDLVKAYSNICSMLSERKPNRD